MSKTNSLTSHHPERLSRRADKMSSELSDILKGKSKKFLKRFASKKRRNLLKGSENKI
jgi:hypothetical protein